jgi:hypothetical protein
MSVKARKDGKPYQSRSGHPWQEYLVTMKDGSVRRTAVPSRGPGSGSRAARRNAEGGGSWRFPDQPTYAESLSGFQS